MLLLHDTGALTDSQCRGSFLTQDRKSLQYDCWRGKGGFPTAGEGLQWPGNPWPFQLMGLQRGETLLLWSCHALAFLGPQYNIRSSGKMHDLLHKMHVKNKVSCGFHGLVLNLSSQPLAELRTVCLSSFSSHKMPQTEARGGGRAGAWTTVMRFSKFCSLVESPWWRCSPRWFLLRTTFLDGRGPSTHVASLGCVYGGGERGWTLGVSTQQDTHPNYLPRPNLPRHLIELLPMNPGGTNSQSWEILPTGLEIRKPLSIAQPKTRAISPLGTCCSWTSSKNGGWNQGWKRPLDFYLSDSTGNITEPTYQCKPACVSVPCASTIPRSMLW